MQYTQTCLIFSTDSTFKLNAFNTRSHIDNRIRHYKAFKLCSTLHMLNVFFILLLAGKHKVNNL